MRRRRRRRLAGHLGRAGCGTVLVVLGAGLGAPGRAGEWLITPGIAVDGSFTSNARLDPPGRENWDFITNVEPSISVHGRGDRLTLDLDASVRLLGYARDRSLSTILPSLQESNTTELIPDLLFLDTRGFVGQQPKKTGEAVSGSQLTGQQGATVATMIVSPYLRNHFGDFADSQLRYSFSQVLSSSGSLGNAMTNAISETLVSGSRFTRLRWTLTAAGSFSHYSSSGDTAARNTYDMLAEASFQYALSRPISLLASFGYENIHDDTLEVQPNGPIASVGVKLTPGPRTSLTLEFNHRYNSNYPSAELTYQISAQSSIRASYSQSIQTSQSSYADDVSFLSTDAFGNFIDARTAQIFSLGNANLGVENSAFRQKTFTISYFGVFERDSINASGYYEARDASKSQSAETAYGGEIGWHHEIDPLNELDTTLRFQHTSGGSSEGGTENTIGLGIAFSHQFTDTLSGVILYNFTNRFSTVSSDRFRENVVSIGLRKTF
jgi:uncharacterized protein (PEP-CTERM system associated)